MEELVKKAKRHEKDAFVTLMNQIESRLYRIAKTILSQDEDAADALQETILTCWEKLSSLQKEEYFMTWVTRVLINHCNDILRQRTRFVSEDVLPEQGNAENGYESAEWKQFLNGLDEKYRLVIYLYYVEGYKTREIAQMLELNENTVKTRLKVGRELLRKRLEPTEDRKPEAVQKQEKALEMAGAGISKAVRKKFA